MRRIASHHLLGLRLTAIALLLTLVNPYPLTAIAEQAATSHKKVNVELIFDSSGSMAQEVSPGVTRIQAAKQVLGDVIDAIPQSDSINVGFRVYGHKGSNQEADRTESCKSTELIVPIAPVDKPALSNAVKSYSPVGWTPLALSLQKAGEDFREPAEGEINAIILVTDGLETCGGNACDAAAAIADSKAHVTTYVVGFGLTAEEQGTLQCIADAGGGLNLNASNADELNDALFTVLQDLQVVVQTGFLEVENIGGVWPKGTVTCAEAKTDSNPKGSSVTYSLKDTNRVEIAAGTCDVSWKNPSGNETHVKVEIQAGQTTWLRGSLLKFPQGAGEIYTVKAQDGTIIWQDQFEFGDYVWVLPGIYTMELLERVGDPVLISAQVQCLPGTMTTLEISTAGS